MNKLSISIFGATGSVGSTTVKIIRNNPEKFNVKVLTAYTNISKLIKLANELNPEIICFSNNKDLQTVKDGIKNKKTKCVIGSDGLIECAHVKSDVVIAGIVGLAGLKPLIESMKRSKKICIANKECFVSAGSLIMSEALKNNVKILPLDSEHSAIFQLLENNNNEVEKIYLTASGGPFYGFSKKQLLNVKAQAAIPNPNWKMGKKISVDSATLMNKGLEIIEAKHLFNIDENKIKVLIHRQSIAHGIVSFKNNTILGAFGRPDMTHPIKYAIYWPEYYVDSLQALDIESLNNLTFENINEDKFHALRLVRSVLKQNSEDAKIILNSSNEVAVKAFLDKKIDFLDILVLVEEALEYVSKSLGNMNLNNNDNLDNILYLDNVARIKTEELIKQRF